MSQTLLRVGKRLFGRRYNGIYLTRKETLGQRFESARRLSGAASLGVRFGLRATFEIHQDRPVAGSPAKSELVHTQYPQRSVGPKPRRTDVI
jgi:hypothetical protein